MKPTLFAFLAVVLLPYAGFCSEDEIQKEIQALEERQKVLQREVDLNAKKIDELKAKSRAQKIAALSSSVSVTSFTLSDADVYEIPSDSSPSSEWKRVGMIPIRTEGVEVVRYSAKQGAYLVRAGNQAGWVLKTSVFENHSVLALKDRDIEKERAELSKLAEQEKTARIATLKKELRDEQARKAASQAAARRRAEERARSLKTRFGSAVAARILKGDVWIGMSKAMAVESIGKPDKINRTVTVAKVHEQWVYGNSVFLYFDGETLTNFQD